MPSACLNWFTEHVGFVPQSLLSQWVEDKQSVSKSSYFLDVKNGCRQMKCSGHVAIWSISVLHCAFAFCVSAQGWLCCFLVAAFLSLWNQTPCVWVPVPCPPQAHSSNPQSHCVPSLVLFRHPWTSGSSTSTDPAFSCYWFLMWSLEYAFAHTALLLF